MGVSITCLASLSKLCSKSQLNRKFTEWGFVKPDRKIQAVRRGQNTQRDQPDESVHIGANEAQWEARGLCLEEDGWVHEQQPGAAIGWLDAIRDPNFSQHSQGANGQDDIRGFSQYSLDDTNRSFDYLFHSGPSHNLLQDFSQYSLNDAEAFDDPLHSGPLVNQPYQGFSQPSLATTRSFDDSLRSESFGNPLHQGFPEHSVDATGSIGDLLHHRSFNEGQYPNFSHDSQIDGNLDTLLWDPMFPHGSSYDQAN